MNDVHFSCVQIVLSMVVAFILDAFVFRIRFSRENGQWKANCTSEVSLSTFECEMSKRGGGEQVSWRASRIADRMSSFSEANSNQVEASSADESVVFEGERSRSPYDFCVQIFKQEAELWQEEHKRSRFRASPLLSLAETPTCYTRSGIQDGGSVCERFCRLFSRQSDLEREPILRNDAASTATFTFHSALLSESALTLQSVSETPETIK